MKLSTTFRALALVTAVAALPLGSGTAFAAAPAPSKVTITAEGTDLSGTVSSKRAACERDRTVVVVKQRGTRGGGDDVKVAEDTTQVQGVVGVWSTGNTGLTGRFYAKAKRTPGCKAASSPTIRVVGGS